ncbi:MAG: MFS transporter [Cyanobacteria bacterium J06634_5]
MNLETVNALTKTPPTHTTRVKTLTLVAMCLALSMTALDDTVVTVALPKLQSTLAMSVTGLQWIINGYLLPIACLVLPAGMLGDRIGRQQVFLAGLIMFTGASVLVGLSVSGPMVIAGRLLQGLGAAALLPTTLAILSDTFSNPQERTKAIGIWSGVSGLALIVGPALGGLLIDSLGWRSIFFLNVPLGALTFWLTQQTAIQKTVIQQNANNRTKQPGNKRPESQPLDLPGMVLSAVMLAAFITMLMGVEASEPLSANSALGGLLSGLLSGLSWRTLSLGVLAVGSALAFWVVETHSAHPMLPPKLFCQRTFATVVVVNALLFFMLVSLLFLFSLFLQQVQGRSALATGIRFLPLNGAFIAASFASGYGSARLGWRATITLGFLLAAVGALTLSNLQPEVPYRALMGQLMLVGFGVGFTLSPLTAAGMGSVPMAQSGIAAALLNTSTRLGGALGIAIQGSLFTQGLGHHLSEALTALSIDTSTQSAIVAEAIGHGATRANRLQKIVAQSAASPVTLSVEMLEETIHQSFVAGMQTVVWVAAIALLIGALLSFAYIRASPSPSQSPRQSP